jgi:hypothetical protein
MCLALRDAPCILRRLGGSLASVLVKAIGLVLGDYGIAGLSLGLEWDVVSTGLVARDDQRDRRLFRCQSVFVSGVSLADYFFSCL